MKFKVSEGRQVVMAGWVGWLVWFLRLREEGDNGLSPELCSLLLDCSECRELSWLVRGTALPGTTAAVRLSELSCSAPGLSQWSRARG